VRSNAEFLGDLRPQCRGEATRRLLASTCGTGKRTCGRYREGARDPVSCRVQRAERCTDAPTFAATACAETHCSEVEEWTAGTCLDPRAPGRFGAGARVISYTKPSVVDPGEDRVLDTVIWYPTSDAGAPQPSHAAILDATVDGSGGPYPVVLFSHGSCGVPTQSTFLTALLATHGFVVVAPPHPGNTFEEFPACGTLPAQLESFRERPQDMVFVLDRILDADLDPGSDFFALIDETRIGISGHSFGGLTTHLTQAIEPRIIAALPMAAAATATSVLTVPSLSILGQVDSVVSNDRIRAAYARSSAPKWLVEIADAGHYAFSNFCFPASDCNPPVTLTQAEAHDAVLRYAVPFLQVHVRGDPAWSPLLVAPPSPTFAVQSEPSPGSDER
jgi:predicted dienelactone hydrolase